MKVFGTGKVASRIEGVDPRAVEAGSPPAIWAAFAKQGAWKNWMLGFQCLVILLLIASNIHIAGKPPEFVLVDSDGRTTYIQRTVATDGLLTYLAERTRPPDLVVTRFTRDFLQKALALNSTTIDEMWAATLSLMSPELRKRVEEDAAKTGALALYRAAQTRSKLIFNDIKLVAQTPNLRHLRGEVTRERSPLSGNGSPQVERLAVDLVLRIIPPRADRPDGLEVEGWEIRDVTNEPAAEPMAAPAAAPR